jgi:hypothetical protein
VTSELVQQQRILELPLRKQSLREPRQKHDGEFASPRFVDRPDEYLPPAAFRRFATQES